MADRAENLEELGNAGGMVIARAAGRRSPGVIVQGDTLFSLLAELEEEAPESGACQTVRGWLAAHESVASDHGFELPYFR